jgi:hypothetical protein
MHRQRECDVATADGRGARATIGLDDITVQRHHTFAECLEIGYGAKGTADQAGYLLGSAALLATGGLARRTRMRRSRQHSVLTGDPTPVLATHPDRYAILDACRTQHTRVPEFRQHAAFRMTGVIGRKTNSANLVRLPAARAHHRSPLFRFLV